ncbi:MAG TPA: DUF4079 family protein [Candidatus Acidoferrales bacterium]|nr:DUF4079 family protein [Candidatus Acidoferrales bacterium]
MNPAYLHPIAGGLTLAFLYFVGSLALRARNNRRQAAALLAQHARLAPWMFVFILISWVAGFASTWWLRRDLDLGASTHLRIGSALVIALTGGWLTSRAMRNPNLRAIHPWFGIAAMLLGAAQVFFGLQITP